MLSSCRGHSCTAFAKVVKQKIKCQKWAKPADSECLLATVNRYHISMNSFPPLNIFLVNYSIYEVNIFHNAETTVFPWIVSAEIIFFWKGKIVENFYFINWIVATETIQGGKLFAEIWYMKISTFSSFKKEYFSRNLFAEIWYLGL